MKSLRAAAVIAFLCGASLSAESPTQNESITDPKLRHKLLRRRDLDQHARKALVDWQKEHGPLPTFAPKPSENRGSAADAILKAAPPGFQKLAKRVQEIDAQNLAWLRGIVADQGWPRIGQVGKEGSAAAWLLVQHADSDKRFQRECLDLMNSLPKQEVSQRNLAYLTDRVLLAEGRKQRFGTQFVPQNGRLVLRPTEDDANLDARRAEVGLPPIAEYLRLAEEVYGYRPPKDKPSDADR